ncbi:MAG: hypothetical protein HY303_17410 [Candidatus Wallbacteria bacterium]|nr:hypothetical protein [Candidatus Wallbacteria bacterium]
MSTRPVSKKSWDEQAIAAKMLSLVERMRALHWTDEACGLQTLQGDDWCVAMAEFLRFASLEMGVQKGVGWTKDQLRLIVFMSGPLWELLAEPCRVEQRDWFVGMLLGEGRSRRLGTTPEELGTWIDGATSLVKKGRRLFHPPQPA